jgi:catechol 2,3-dioxygenase-like lactoylglutathione lyase family enzyme
MPQVTGIDHIYITVSDMARSQAFYTTVLGQVLGFRHNSFTLGGDPHVQFYNRHFGYVLRPARLAAPHQSIQPHHPYSPGLHHLCFRVDSAADVAEVSQALQAAGIAATDARLCPEYAPDYWATYFTDPDGIRLEVTNYRLERRQRHDEWENLPP